MLPYTEITQVREKIGETIPDGGVEADTLFTDAQIDSWIDTTSSLDAAAARGWEVKMAHFASLVDVTDGAASRKMSDLMLNAEKMMKIYTRRALGPAAGRTRIGKIRRP